MVVLGWIGVVFFMPVPGLFQTVQRGPETVRINEVEGHATEACVEQGRVRAEDKFGNAEADTAAYFGKRHQTD